MKTRQVQASDVEALVGRFSAQKTVRERAKEQGVPLPDFVYSLLISKDLFTIIGDEKASASWLKPLLKGPKEFSMVISRVDPGEGPSLHTHKETMEIFLVLDGKFLIQVGDKGEHSVTLDRFDTMVVPPGIMRRYQNASDGPAHLLAIVTGGTDNMAEIDYVPDAGRIIESDGGPAVRKTLENIGITFTAGE
jgi:quercetin dioxygenase-like cupin family protein